MTTPSLYRQIIQELASILSKVEGVGRVHEYQRQVNDPERFKDLFFDTANDRVLTWMWSRESFIDEQSANTTNDRRAVYVARGFMGISDDKRSEHEFQELIVSICEAFRPQTNLAGLVELTEPLQARNIGYADFGGVLCHAAELTIIIQEHLTS